MKSDISVQTIDSYPNQSRISTLKYQLPIPNSRFLVSYFILLYTHILFYFILSIYLFIYIHYKYYILRFFFSFFFFYKYI